MNLSQYRLLLVSNSPRRKQLLQEAGFEFEVKSNAVKEDFPEDLPVEEVAAFLAKKKATGAKHFLNTNEIVLTADSVVILDGIIYGKPIDRNDAIQTLEKLSGKMHLVITGVCLLSKYQERIFSSVSKVYFDPLTAEEIAYYVDNFKPYDKAGSYGIQEWLGWCKINRIEGTYANIMGLPIDRVYREIQHFGSN